MQKKLIYLLLVLVMALPQIASTQTKKTSKDVGTVKQGFSGDPAAKRGSLIGYDLGRAQGKADKASNTKANPQGAKDYINAEKFHRSEYGLRSNFVAGFKKGFLAGYSSAYKGEKVGAKTKSGDAIVVGEPEAAKTEVRKINVRDDAM